MGEVEGVEELEKIVDALGIELVISKLAEICYLKADHSRSNWQDNVMARWWESKGKKLDKVL